MKKSVKLLTLFTLVLFIASLVQLSLPSAAESAGRVVRGRTKATATTASKAKTPPTFAGGAGTAKSPYIIRTATQFVAFIKSVNNGNSYAGRYVKLGGDIDLGMVGWVPVGIPVAGGKTHPFSGAFDGGGYTVWNLRSTNTSRTPHGLFGVLEGATISRVSLQYVELMGDSNVGAIAGSMKNSVIKDCTVSGTITGSSGVGGLVGTALGGAVQNCTFFGRVKADGMSAGGAIGTMDQTAVQSVSVRGRVEANEAAGGLAGSVFAGRFVDCSANQLVVEGRENVGGMIGNVVDNADAMRLKFDGQITGETSVGGLVGRMMAGTFTHCSVSGSVLGMGDVGGFVGDLIDGDLQNGVSRASITGGTNVGGIVGFLRGGRIENCANSGTVRGGESVGGLVGNLDRGSLSGGKTTGSVAGAYDTGRMTGVEGGGARLKDNSVNNEI